MVVYLITNLINGKRYVGQTVQGIKKRFQHHCWSSTVKTRMPIAMAIAKYGKKNFTIEILCNCSSQEELDRMEIQYAKELNTFSPNGYNLRAGKGTGFLSQEARDRISRRMKGRRPTVETIAKLSASHMGIRMTNETKRKLSDANKGKPGTPYCYQRASEASAKTFILYSPGGTKTTIHNMRKFCLGNNLSCPKMCEVVKGKKLHHKGWTLDPQLHIIAAVACSKYKTDRYFFNDRGRRFYENRSESPSVSSQASSDQPVLQ